MQMDKHVWMSTIQSVINHLKSREPKQIIKCLTAKLETNKPTVPIQLYYVVCKWFYTSRTQGSYEVYFSSKINILLVNGSTILVHWKKKIEEENKPVMVPWTIVPFLSSMDTVSLFNFIKNLVKQYSRIIRLWSKKTEKKQHTITDKFTNTIKRERERDLTSFMVNRIVRLRLLLYSPSVNQYRERKKQRCELSKL